MNVVASSWRRSLAALAVAALLTPISGDAAADYPAPDGRSPVVSADQLALLDDDERGEREEGDREKPREGERREREETQSEKQGTQHQAAPVRPGVCR